MNEAGEYGPTEEDIKRQEEFFAKSKEEQREIVDRKVDFANQENRVRKLKEIIQAEKNLPETQRLKSVDFESLNKGDVLILERMELVDFDKIPKFFERLEKRAETLPDDDPTKKLINETVQSGRLELSKAYNLPVGDGERQLIFQNVSDIISKLPELFDDNNVKSAVRLEVVGYKKMSIEGKEEDCLIVQAEKDSFVSSKEGKGVVRFPRSKFQIDDLSGKFGYINGQVKEESGRFREGYPISRIGRAYRTLK